MRPLGDSARYGLLPISCRHLCADAAEVVLSSSGRDIEFEGDVFGRKPASCQRQTLPLSLTKRRAAPQRRDPLVYHAFAKYLVKVVPSSKISPSVAPLASRSVSSIQIQLSGSMPISKPTTYNLLHTPSTNPSIGRNVAL
jgi:hypothetical protein